MFALVPASYVYLRRGDHVLLQRRANTGYMDGCWVAGAAGHIEPGETARSAAARELAEEVGARVAADDLSLLTVMQRTDGAENPLAQRVDWFWAARDWTGEPRILEPNKCSGLDWFELDALPEPMPVYERLVLDGWRAGDLPTTTAYGFSR